MLHTNQRILSTLLFFLASGLSMPAFTDNNDPNTKVKCQGDTNETQWVREMTLQECKDKNGEVLETL